MYIVKMHKSPVFFIEIKPFPDLDALSTRKRADNQMRDRFLSLITRHLAIPKLYGVSAMGTRFSVYEYDKDTTRLSPPAIVADPNYVTDVAPVERWCYELFEEAGEKRLKEMVAETKGMCKAAF